MSRFALQYVIDEPLSFSRLFAVTVKGFSDDETPVLCQKQIAQRLSRKDWKPLVAPRMQINPDVPDKFDLSFFYRKEDRRLKNGEISEVTVTMEGALEKPKLLVKEVEEYLFQHGLSQSKKPPVAITSEFGGQGKGKDSETSDTTGGKPGASKAVTHVNPGRPASRASEASPGSARKPATRRKAETPVAAPRQRSAVAQAFSYLVAVGLLFIVISFFGSCATVLLAAQ